jgi:hypothetical protein
MSRTSITFLLSPVLFGGLVWGGASCSDDSSISAENFAAEYAQAYCDYHFRCCGSAERSYGSKSQCVNQQQDRAESMLAFIAAGAGAFASFDGTKGRSCIDSLLKDGCSEVQVACLDQVTRAKHTEGEACTYSSECESFYCVQEEAGTKGYCGAQSGSCSGDDRACASGSYCDGIQCQTKKDSTQPCGRPGECMSGICSPSKICGTAEAPLCDGQ